MLVIYKNRDKIPSTSWEKIINLYPKNSILCTESPGELDKALEQFENLLRAMSGTSGEIGFLQAVEDAGFSSQKIGHFLVLFRSFAEEHAGQAHVKKVFSEAPDLALLAREHAAQE